MNNDHKGKRIEFHILQSFPVSCLNRDDVGSPKTAMIGGVTRARVSSQAWKRQVRMQMHEMGIRIACRTKLIKEKILECFDEADKQRADRPAQIISDILAKDTLYFFSETEAKGLAHFIVDNEYLENIQEKALAEKAFANKVFKAQKDAAVKGFEALDGLDIALFGRMVANSQTLSIEAAASFAHAISTHKVSNEIDFFTALDDQIADEDQTRTSHLGSNEFNSATYYRYVSLDLGQLAATIGDDQDNIDKAINAFTKALFVAVPFARQATMSSSSPWDFARVYVRNGQKIQASFENPVKSKGEGFLKPSIETLKTELDNKEKMCGSMFGLKGKHEWGENPCYSIDDLIEDLVNDSHEG